MKPITILALLSLVVPPLLAEEAKWVSIFNGKDLAGWTPKIRGLELGEDPNRTFVVRDGVLAVDYSNSKKWDNDFGHLFWKDKVSHYRIRLEYRFVGKQVEGGEGWANENSGIMLHCQDPKTMAKEQGFPVCLEFQLLGAANPVKSTGNLCTPGTFVTLGGEVNKNHCINCEQASFPAGEWVSAEAEVRGGKLVKHLINGKTVMEYTDLKLDPADGDAKPLIEILGSDELTAGWISLQSESSPCEFRKIEIMELED